jgi:hypothetical protein
MILVCAWCQEVLGEKEGQGSTHGICDECLEKLRTGHLKLGETLTSGRCPKCMIRFVWNRHAMVRRAFCPFCETRLRRTTSLYRRGISVAIERPLILRRLRPGQVIKQPKS